MDDRQLVAGIRLGDRTAVAELYRRYADLLYDYAARRTNSAADAADVVHDAFLVAIDRIGQLRDPDRLRPWMYAIARTELHRRYRHAARYTELDTLDEWREPVSQEPGPELHAERAELVTLLREATAGLADSDRELLDLHLRHGLVGADLAAAAGLPARHASVALDRVKSRLARTLGVVLLARRPTCQEFAAIRGAHAELTPLIRKRLARHVDNCEVCGEEQARRMRPEVLLAAAPILPAPPELRHRLVAARGRPQLAGYVWDADGFPRPSRPGSRRWLLWTAAAWLIVLMIGGAVLATRPMVTERAVAGPTTPVASTSVTPSQPPAILSGTTTATTAEAAPEPSTTTTARTTTPPTTTRPAPRTTTTPPDTAPPDLGRIALSPNRFSATRGGVASCQGLSTTATVQALVSDESGIAAVTMTWSGPGGSGATVTMSASGGGYSAAVGPVVGDNLAPDVYSLSVTVTARDNRGNEAKRGMSFQRTVNHCEQPPVIG